MCVAAYERNLTRNYNPYCTYNPILGKTVQGENVYNLENSLTFKNRLLTN